MLELEDWMSGRNMNCFIFLREQSESGKHESNLPERRQYEQSEYSGGLDEWLISTVY